MSEFAHETVIAHSDPSPARDQVLRQAEVRHAPINIQIALPSLEGIKRAVEKKMGVALLPRRCAVAEIERKQLVAVKIPEVRYPRQLRLLYRKGELSHARKHSGRGPAVNGWLLWLVETTHSNYQRSEAVHVRQALRDVSDRSKSSSNTLSRPRCPRVNASRAPAGTSAW